MLKANVTNAISVLKSVKFSEEELARRLSACEVVAFDLDGTLFDDEKDISSSNRFAVEQIARSGVLVLVATGRVASVLPSVVQSLPGLFAIVGANGSSIMKVVPGGGIKLVHECGIMSEEGSALISQLIENFDVYIDVADHGGLYTSAGMLARIATREFEISPQQVDFVCQTRLERPDFVRFERINVYTRNPDERKQVRDWLEKKKGLSFANSLGTNIEINAQGISKWDGIRQCAEVAGYDWHHCMVMGDGTNDISMIKAASVGVAMDNAPTVVKTCADAVAPCNVDDGVAYALTALLDMKKVSRRQ
jgi:Cof subfamily protein (haloacid dehalogenase superfamily)